MVAYDIFCERKNRTEYKYDSATDTWTRILGSGSPGGFCVDGTLATSCDTRVSEAFITAQGNVYFVDGGLIRTIDENNKVKTLFGQSKKFGDGGLATSARFNLIASIDQGNDGRIGLLDAFENVIREFTVGGAVNTIAGNGKLAGFTEGGAAPAQAIPGGYWGNEFQIQYDQLNNDIYFTGTNSVGKFDRVSSTVSTVIGHGGTSMNTADGLAGLATSFELDFTYPPQILGFDGSKILMSTQGWNGSQLWKSKFKLYDKTDSYRQSHFAGNDNLVVGSYYANGAPVATADVPVNFGNGNLKAQWDSLTNTWYTGIYGTTLIRALPVGGNISTYATLPRGIRSWTMITNASSQKIIYYCAVDGRVYKYNLTTATETAFSWPSSSIICQGASMFQNATRSSVVFPFNQNGLAGIAEIVDPSP